MFNDRLKEKIVPQNKWDDQRNNHFNKGMTWQAEKSEKYIENNDKFMTKFQFAKKGGEKNYYH